MNKFEAMFGEYPTLYPLDEVEEDADRRETGLFTGACKPKMVMERLQHGGIGGDNVHVAR